MAAKDQIGSGSFVLSANADGLASGLYKAAGDVKKWANGTSGSLGGQAKSVGVSIADGIRGGIGFALAKGGIDGVGGFVTGLVETIKDTAKQGSMASALGLTPEQFTGMAGLAKSVGEDTKEFIESLVTLGKVASEGAEGKGEVAVQFFKDLNIEAKEFASLRSDQQFFRFFEAAQQIQDPLKRVRSLMVAFGEDGGKLLLPLLSKSPAELRRMAAGFEVSSNQMKAATVSNEALNRAQAQLSKLWRATAIAAAPVLEFLAGELEVLTQQFPKLDQVGGDSITNLIRLTAKLSDTFKGLSGVMLYSQGLLLKYHESAILAYSAIKGAQMGGAPGASAGVILGMGVIAKLKSMGAGKGLTAAGELMMDMGGQMIDDAGKAVDRAEEFIKKFQARNKPVPPDLPGGGGPPGGLVNTPKAWEPAKFAGAVKAGSEEAYRLTISNLYGDFKDKKDDVPKQQLKEMKDLNKGVGKVATAVESLKGEWELV